MQHNPETLRTLPGIAALLAYTAAAPAVVCEEGYWDDQESANADGMRQEKSQAAALMRAVLVELGIEAPAGVRVCPICFQTQADGHSTQCERDDDDDFGTGDVFTVTLRAASIQVTAKGEAQAARYAESDAREFVRQHTYTVEEANEGDEYATPGGLDNADIEVELREAGPKRGEGIWTFDALVTFHVRAADEEAAGAEALKLIAEERS